jgi:predicted anti-sigma-YlaC factor YlaD
MSCRELVELVTDYFEGALDADERARFEAHLDECPGCRTYLDQMRVTLRLVRDAGQLEERTEVAELLAAFREYRRS